MRDDRTGRLDARIWIMEADHKVLVGQRRYGKGGSVEIIWHVAPDTIRGVMWIEITGGEENPASAS